MNERETKDLLGAPPAYEDDPAVDAGRSRLNVILLLALSLFVCVGGLYVAHTVKYVEFHVEQVK